MPRHGIDAGECRGATELARRGGPCALTISKGPIGVLDWSCRRVAQRVLPDADLHSSPYWRRWPSSREAWLARNDSRMHPRRPLLHTLNCQWSAHLGWQFGRQPPQGPDRCYSDDSHSISEAGWGSTVASRGKREKPCLGAPKQPSIQESSTPLQPLTALRPGEEADASP